MLRKKRIEVEDDDKSFLSVGRIEALTDGVIAIVMTLLVLELKVPDAPGVPLWASLLHLWPVYASYAASFVMLGVFWVSHVIQFNSIRFADRTLLWLNLAFLFSVSVVPFSAAVLSGYWGSPLASVLYGCNLIVIGGIGYVHWCYATRHHRLVDHELPAALVNMAARRILFAPVICVIAMAMSFLAPTMSLLLYAVIPLYYILPGTIDAFWERKAEPHDD